MLEAALDVCNRAASHASRVARDSGARHKYALQDKVYHQLKAEFDRKAQPTPRAIGKVADAYTTRKANLDAGNLGRKGSASASGWPPPRSPTDASGSVLAEKQRSVLRSPSFARLRGFTARKARGPGSRSWTRPTPLSPARTTTTTLQT
ncbi:hypothetical protein HNR07_000399 [Nocardiopsis metallicus]|uniref:Uncharacterized protein n=1 Tax=Nocardiopsis metallicus TaxID=179819 RepID=A0A840VZN6_9ACTN|nr:hypothetical protein [Nocardiopsis metallicus]